MNRFYRMLDAFGKSGEQRADPSISLDQLLGEMFSFNGSGYPLGFNQSMVGNKETAPNSFIGYIQQAYKSNGAVFACQMVRTSLFSEARFQFQRITAGRPGKLFGTQALDILETPWSGATTGDLLSRAIQDADLAGNFFGCLHQGQIKRLRPDWVSILLGNMDSPVDGQPSAGDLDAEVIAYVYQPGGPGSGQKPQTLMPDEVIHFAPIPDPAATFRGMSWLTPIMREIMSDSAATSHKLAFFENAATPNMIIAMDPTMTNVQFNEWIKTFRHEHEGTSNAYKTMYLAGGATPHVVGNDLKQMDFKTVQGAGETRIAAAAGVPPVIVGLSEGLQAATYSNYAQARRRLADGTMRPLWRNFAGSLERIIQVPGGARLWYDDRDIPFLQEDRKDAADIMLVKAQAINTLVLAGMDPQTVIDSVEADDLSQLEHTGLTSVQLHPPSDGNEPDPALPEPAKPLALPAPKAKAASAEILAPWLPLAARAYSKDK